MYSTNAKVQSGVWAIESVAYPGRYVLLSSSAQGAPVTTTNSSASDEVKVC
jgi:hypothetical protein